MKRSAQPLRTTANLSASINRQLNLYTLAAGAAGVAMLAGAKPAVAEIVYTPVHDIILTNHKISLDLNHDGIADFVISNHAFCTTDICGRTLQARPQGASNKVEGMRSVFILKFASALNRGAQIGPSADFSGKLMAVSGTEYGSGGNWQNVSDRYLGLKFSIAGSIHYGWARFNVTAGTGKITAQLTGYAYETVANQPILAGKTSGSAPIIEGQVVEAPDASPGLPAPGPATIGLLAMGSLGFSSWRRRDLD